MNPSFYPEQELEAPVIKIGGKGACHCIYNSNEIDCSNWIYYGLQWAFEAIEYYMDLNENSEFL